MLIRETLSDSISLAVINEYDKGTVMEISTTFGHVYHIPIEASSETGLFRHLSDYAFGIRNFEKRKSMTVILFPKCSIFNLDLKNEAKNEKKFNLPEIIASELVSLNFLY